MAEVYIHLRDAYVEATEAVDDSVNLDLDGAGGLVGVEVLGAAWVEIDGVRVTPQASSAERSIDPYIVEVLRYVSAGRGYVDVEPYPDSAARIALGRLQDEGLL